MFFPDRIASPDFRGLSIEERHRIEASAAAYFARQRLASTVATRTEPSEAVQVVRTIDMSLPPMGTPVFAQETM